MTKKWICPRCDGVGYDIFEEDGRLVQHSCYHCGETGYVEYDPEEVINEELQIAGDDFRHSNVDDHEYDYEEKEAPISIDDINEKLQIIANEES